MPQAEIKWTSLGPLSEREEAAVAATVEQLQKLTPEESEVVTAVLRPIMVGKGIAKVEVQYPPAKGATSRKTRVAADDPLSVQRVEYLSTVFKRAELARWIGVSPSQTSRWASGHERPGPAAAAALIDLEHVYSRARLVWGGDAARIWLESPNAFLSGAKPSDVLLTEGPARILEALDAEMWGGAA